MHSIFSGLLSASWRFWQQIEEQKPVLGQFKISTIESILVPTSTSSKTFSCIYSNPIYRVLFLSQPKYKLLCSLSFSLALNFFQIITSFLMAWNFSLMLELLDEKLTRNLRHHSNIHTHIHTHTLTQVDLMTWNFISGSSSSSSY